MCSPQSGRTSAPIIPHRVQTILRKATALAYSRAGPSITGSKMSCLRFDDQ
jgi:hypothetical protein